TQGFLTPVGILSPSSYCRYEFSSVSVTAVRSGAAGRRPATFLLILSIFAWRRAASRRETGSTPADAAAAPRAAIRMQSATRRAARSFIVQVSEKAGALSSVQAQGRRLK